MKKSLFPRLLGHTQELLAFTRGVQLLLYYKLQVLSLKLFYFST